MDCVKMKTGVIVQRDPTSVVDSRTDLYTISCPLHTFCQSRIPPWRSHTYTQPLTEQPSMRRPQEIFRMTLTRYPGAGLEQMLAGTSNPAEPQYCSKYGLASFKGVELKVARTLSDWCRGHI